MQNKTLQSILSSKIKIRHPLWLEEFMNGDCHLLADILHHFALEEQLQSRLLLLKNAVGRTRKLLIHSFVEITRGNQVLYLDAQGVSSCIEELFEDAKLNNEEMNELKELIQKLESFNEDDVRVSNLINMSNMAKMLNQDFDGYADNLFDYQQTIADYFLRSLHGEKLDWGGPTQFAKGLQSEELKSHQINRQDDLSVNEIKRNHN